MPQTDKPNILVIWGDDIGITSICSHSADVFESSINSKSSTTSISRRGSRHG
jgi:arylsulfatase A-like enzyme